MWSKYDFSQIPFENIQRVGQRSLLYRDLFSVSWIVNRYCNFSCSYCWPFANSKKKQFRELKQMVLTMDEIISQARARDLNSFHFSFTGGEPTMNPGFLGLVEHYVSQKDDCNYSSISTVSNMSQTESWYKSYAKITRKLDRSTFTASYHDEFSKKNKFIEKALILKHEGLKITINIVMVPQNFYPLLDIAREFHEQKINVTLKPATNAKVTGLMDGYNEEMLEIIKMGMPQYDYGNADKSTKEYGSVPEMQFELLDADGKKWYLDQAERLNGFGFNNFEGWECAAGYSSCSIVEPLGIVKRGNSCVDKPLGYAGSPLSLFDNIKACKTQAPCCCTSDSKVPKRRAESSLGLFSNKYEKND